MSPPDRIVDSLQRVDADLSELARLAGDERTLAARAEQVSAWSVAEHVEHLLASDELILDGLQRLVTDPSAGKPGRPNLLGRLCLRTGWIPRGRGRAPQAVVPQGAEPAELRERLRSQEQGFAALRDGAAALSASAATLPHPVFGRLGPPAWLRFVEIHHRHHQKIIRDILRAAEATSG